MYCQVMTGGHTGTISATGGDSKTGGGGAGGRIAVYFSNHERHSFYGGTLETQGGSAGPNAEPGASGTVYLEHVGKGYRTVRVDNKNQKSLGDVIDNVGQRLPLYGGTNSATTYSVPGTIILIAAHYYSNRY